MKKKIALIVLLVLAIACILTACNDKAVASLEVVDFTNEYMQNSTIDYNSVSVKVTYDDDTTETKTLKEWKDARADVSWTTVNTANVGKSTFKVVFGAVETSKEVTIVASYLDEGSRVTSFNKPAFITRYEAQSTSTANTDATFAVKNLTYEVGNANAFVLEPSLVAMNTNQDQLTQNAQVPTTLSLKVGDDVDSLTEVSASEIANHVVKNGNAYSFTEASAGKLYQLTIALDNADNYYTVPSTIKTSFTLLVKVVDNGYNVYDQMGLSVMNDATDYKYWKDIWKVDIATDGSLVARDDSIQLSADDQPLFKYVGQVDWIILHGDITLNADLLPGDYFYLDKTADEYSAGLSALQGAEAELNMKEELYGSLKDGNKHGEGKFLITSLGYDNNNNKAFYQTTRANVSGNYFTIVVPEGRSETGRTLKAVVNYSTENPNYPYNQWNVFKQMEKTSTAEPSIDFTIKNIGMFGNTGHTEKAGPQGIVMAVYYAKTMTFDNVVGQGFFQNASADNFNSSAKTQSKLVIKDSKLTDSYNAMVFSWRCAIDVENSILKGAGGPVFILSDGSGREANDTANISTLNIDDKSIVEAYAMGNESWYLQLGEEVPLLFSMITSIDAKISPVSGRSYIEKRNAGDYINVIAVLIPEAGDALESNQWNSTGKIIHGVVNKVTTAEGGEKVYTPVFDNRLVSFNPGTGNGQNPMDYLMVHNNLYTAIELQRTAVVGGAKGSSTFTIQSGGNLAIVYGQEATAYKQDANGNYLDKNGDIIRVGDHIDKDTGNIVRDENANPITAGDLAKYADIIVATEVAATSVVPTFYPVYTGGASAVVEGAIAQVQAGIDQYVQAGAPETTPELVALRAQLKQLQDLQKIGNGDFITAESTWHKQWQDSVTGANEYITFTLQPQTDVVKSPFISVILGSNNVIEKAE